MINVDEEDLSNRDVQSSYLKNATATSFENPPSLLQEVDAFTNTDINCSEQNTSDQEPCQRSKSSLSEVHVVVDPSRNKPSPTPSSATSPNVQSTSLGSVLQEERETSSPQPSLDTPVAVHEDNCEFSEINYHRVPAIMNKKRYTVEVDMQYLNLLGFGEFDWIIWKYLRLNSESLEPEPRISVRSFGKVVHSNFSNFLKRKAEESQEHTSAEEATSNQEHQTNTLFTIESPQTMVEPIEAPETEFPEETRHSEDVASLDDKSNIPLLHDPMHETQASESTNCLYPEVLLNEIKTEAVGIPSIKQDPDELNENMDDGTTEMEAFSSESNLNNHFPIENVNPFNQFGTTPLEATSSDYGANTFNEFSTEGTSSSHSPLTHLQTEFLNQFLIEQSREEAEMVEILVPMDDDDTPEEPVAKKPKKKYTKNKNKNRKVYPRVNMLKVVGVTSLAVNHRFDEEDGGLPCEEPFDFKENTPETADLEEMEKYETSASSSNDSLIPSSSTDVLPEAEKLVALEQLHKLKVKRKKQVQGKPSVPKQVYQNTDVQSNCPDIDTETKRKLAAEQLDRLALSRKRGRPPQEPLAVPEQTLPSPFKESYLDKNLMDFLPLTDFLEQIFRIWYGDLYLTNVCAQQIAKKYNNLHQSRNLEPFFIFMKFRILLDHWRKKTFFYRKYKNLEEFDPQEVFKKLNFICGFGKASSFACAICNRVQETILDLRRHFADKHLDTNECCFCNTTFLNNDLLGTHIIDQHDSEIWFRSSKDFHCVQCNLFFKTDNLFLKHIETIH